MKLLCVPLIILSLRNVEPSRGTCRVDIVEIGTPAVWASGVFPVADDSTVVTVLEGTGTAIFMGTYRPIGPNNRINPGSRITCDRGSKLILLFGDKWKETVLPGQPTYVVPYVPANWLTPESALDARRSHSSKQSKQSVPFREDTSSGRIAKGEGILFVGGRSVPVKQNQRIFPTWRLQCKTGTTLVIAYRNGTTDTIKSSDGQFTVPSIDVNSSKKNSTFDIGGRMAQAKRTVPVGRGQRHSKPTYSSRESRRDDTRTVTAAREHERRKVPVGIVTDGHGTESLGGDSRQLALLDVIFSNSIIKCNDGNKLVIKYLTGREQTVLPGHTLKVTELKSDYSSQLNALVYLSGSRSITEHIILSPYNRGLITPAHLIFRWGVPFPIGTKLSLTIRQAPVKPSDKPVWTTEIAEDGTGVHESSVVKDMLNNTVSKVGLTFEFSLVLSSEGKKIDEVTFRVLSKEGQERLLNRLNQYATYSLPFKQLARASVFYSYGLYTETASELDELLLAYPESTRLRLAAISAHSMAGNDARVQLLTKELPPGTKVR
jgi:hypothetical protein